MFGIEFNLKLSFGNFKLTDVTFHLNYLGPCMEKVPFNVCFLHWEVIGLLAGMAKILGQSFSSRTH